MVQELRQKGRSKDLKDLNKISDPPLTAICVTSVGYAPSLSPKMLICKVVLVPPSPSEGSWDNMPEDTQVHAHGNTWHAA